MGDKSWKTWKSNQKTVMDEKIVKNFLMGAKFDPKVVMDLFIFKIGGWNILQSSNRTVSIIIPSRDSFFMMQYLGTTFCV